MRANRKALWLGAIVIVAAVAVIAVRSMYESAPAAEASAVARSRPGQAGRGDTAPEAESVDVNLKTLTRLRGEPRDEGRNPFRFRPKPPPPPPPAPPGGPGSGNQSAGPVVPGGPPPPPPIPLKFIGIVQTADGTRIAVLSDGRRPYHGLEGQTIEGRYQILKIGNESIEMAYLDGRGRRTIPLTGQ